MRTRPFAVRRRRGVLTALLTVVALGLAAALAFLEFGGRGDGVSDASGADTLLATDPAQVAQGAYLARAGHCAGCHTLPGGAAYAGGRGIPTPFGTVYASNLTPDRATGLGRWTAAQFRRALHDGRSADGRLLYPAFPYPNYTRVTDADADALFAYLRTLAPVARPNRPHDLSFPFDRQAALAVWRALYFRPGGGGDPAGAAADDPIRRRGAYLVEGLGHCNACHASRNALGATRGPLDLAGGLIPVQNWYAPSLHDADEAGVADWPVDDVVALLKTGVAPRGTVHGPMRDVVRGSTQYLTDGDLRAVAAFLQSLPPTRADARRAPAREAADAPVPQAGKAADDRGAHLYADHCAACHGERGAGAPGIYPPLAGNRTVAMRTPVNLIHLVLEGGFAPSTAGNPRPFGMPPFAGVLADEEVAQVLSHVRASWGNHAEAVTALDVAQFRRRP